MSDITQPESQANARTLEAVKMRIKDLMTSRFSLVKENISLPTTLKTEPKAQEYPDDIIFRNEVSRVLPAVLGQEGNVLVIQNIATQHAIATAPVFLEAGLDTYFTQGSYYNPERVMEVVLANEQRIRKAKEKLERNNLRGIVITIDAHAIKEDNSGKFDKFMPTEEQLRELDIDRIVLMGEFAAQNAQGLTERRINKKEGWDKSHIYDYMRDMKSKGYQVSLIGVDTRKRDR